MERSKWQTIFPEIGDVGQSKLSKAHVAVVSVGGLGCPSLAYLTSSGIGSFTID